MATVKIAAQLQPILERFEGQDLNQKLARLVANELRRYLEECEREMLDLEIRYGMDYGAFKERLAEGKLGDEFSYVLEKDALRWEDLLAEKRLWLSQLKALEGLLR